MGVTAYSIIVSVLFYNISLIALALLRRSGVLRAKYISALLLLMTLLAGLRLVLPFDLKFALILRSYRVMPAAKRFLASPLFGTLSLGRLLLLVWAVGIVAFVLRDITQQLRFWRSERHMILIEDEQIERIAAEFPGAYSVKVSPQIQLPFVTGLFKPVIYLPDIELSDEQWRNIFRHETQHIRSGDEWKKLFFRLVRALFWWNPLARLSERDISLLIELQCDERVAGSGDLDEQEGYLRTMVALMRHYLAANVPVTAAPLIGSQSEMEIRFEALLAPVTKRSLWLRRIMPPVLVALFLASYLVIFQPAGFPGDEEILSYQPNIDAYDITDDVSENSGNFILLEDGAYKLYIGGEYVSQLDEEFLTAPDFINLPIINGGK